MFMDCYFEAVKKPIKHDKTKPQTLTVVYVFLDWSLNLSKSNQGFVVL